MNSFYSETELEKLGLKKYGKNVLISKKASVYGAENIVLGDNVRVDDFCILSGLVEIGSYVHIAAYSAIYGSDVGVFINDFANISSRVTIYSISDDYSGESMTNPMVPEKYKNIERGRVYIGKHAIIGSTSVVLPGVYIEDGGSFGSFSFINHNTEKWSIYAGIPVKKIRDRKKDLLEKEMDLLSERI